MLLYIPREQRFENRPSAERILTSERYPEAGVSLNVNQNLIDFYDSYPESTINNDKIVSNNAPNNQWIIDNRRSEWSSYSYPIRCLFALHSLLLRSGIAGM